MKRKQLILILLIIFCTGCTGKYKLEIVNGKIKEETQISYNNIELSEVTPFEKTLEISSKYSDNGDFLSYENQETFTNDNESGIILSNEYNSVEDYNENSSIIGSCYNATSFTNVNNYITLKTSESFTCYDFIEEFENIDIMIETNHKLVSTNADEKDGYTYIWHITKDNAKNKKLELQLYSDKYVWNYNNSAFKRLGIVIISMILVGLIAFTAYKMTNKFNKNKNRI